MSANKILKDLIETNIRQRGDIGGSAKKVGLRIKELERIYGIEHGNNQRTANKYKSSKSQEQLAADLGISIPTLQNYKQLADMIPELEGLLDTEIVIVVKAAYFVLILWCAKDSIKNF